MPLGGSAAWAGSSKGPEEEEEGSGREGEGEEETIEQSALKWAPAATAKYRWKGASTKDGFCSLPFPHGGKKEPLVEGLEKEGFSSQNSLCPPNLHIPRDLWFSMDLILKARFS